MRYLKFLALSLLLARCGVIGAGTLGGFREWTFPASEKRLDKEMTVLYQNNPAYMIPEKWKYLDDWEEGGYGFLKGKIVYFQNNPEEMYYVSYFEIDTNSSGNDNDFMTTTVSVRAVNSGNGWDKKEDFKKNKTEIDRIDKRFHDEIIGKLESQINSKSEDTTPWYENY